MRAVTTYSGHPLIVYFFCGLHHFPVSTIINRVIYPGDDPMQRDDNLTFMMEIDYE
jgi:hypothetical protein